MNEDMTESINALQEFVDYCYQELSLLQFSGYHKRKKKVFLPLYINACDLAGSVVHLLKDERVNSAGNLLRTLKESTINARFIYATGSNLWVDSYLLEGETEGSRFAGGINSLRSKYPHLGFSPDMFTNSVLAAMRRRSEKFKSYIRNKYTTLPTIPDVSTTNLLRKNYSIKDRTRILDYYSSYRDSEGKLKYSDEWDYTLLYSHLSGGTHASTSFLGSNLLGRDRQGVTISRHGNLQQTQLIALTTLASLIDITELFQFVFDCKDSDNLSVFKELAHELKTRLP